jgi:hypothetical protein
MMRGLILVGSAFLIIGSGWAQERPEAQSVADVTLSVVGDPAGLDAYVAEMRKVFKQAWIERWPDEGAESGRLVMRFRVNQAGYLELVEANCIPFQSKGFCEPDAKPPAPPTPIVPMRHSALVGNMESNRDFRRERMNRSAMDAVHSAFVGRPPAPPDDYPAGVITLKVTFVYGIEKPQL